MYRYAKFKSQPIEGNKASQLQSILDAGSPRNFLPCVTKLLKTDWLGCAVSLQCIKSLNFIRSLPKCAQELKI